MQYQLPAWTGDAAVNWEGQAPVVNDLDASTADWAQVTDTTDIDEAIEILRPAFFPVDITPSGRNPLRIRVKAEQLPLLSIGYLDLGGQATIRVADMPGYQIAVVVSGHSVSKWSGGHATTLTSPGSATVFRPGADVEQLWSRECAQLGIKIAPAVLAGELEHLLDRSIGSPVEFARRLDLRDTSSQSWLSLVALLAREVGNQAGILAHRLPAAHLQHMLIEGLLLTQPHNYTDALRQDGGPASAAAVHESIDLMRSYPEWDWTTAALARATGVSARALQKAFAKSGELPPMTYLRNLRLHRVRAELADGSRARNSAAVTTAASRWGFVHLGRFAQQYRQLFGEPPSQTLRVSDR
jgi:AraC-like DNA-binding protein